MSKDEMSLAEQDRFIACDKIIKAGSDTFIDVGLALLEVRDGKLFRRDYKTFQECCEKRWGFTRQRGYQLIAEAKVADRVKNRTGAIAKADSAPTRVGAPITPTTKQSRAMSKLSEEGQLEAWEKAQELADGKKPTQKHVEQAVKQVQGAQEPENPPTDAATGGSTGVGTSTGGQGSDAGEAEQTPKAGSLEERQSLMDTYIAALKAARKACHAAMEFGEDKTPTAPWITGFSYTGTAAVINELLRDADRNYPVGGTAKHPKTRHTEKKSAA